MDESTLSPENTENEEPPQLQQITTTNRSNDSSLLNAINAEESEAVIIDLCTSPSTSSSSASQKPIPSTNSAGADNQTSSTESNETGATGNTLECPICLQSCIHPARLPCGHIFCFLCVKGVAYKNRRCAMCRREIPPEFLDHPQLVNGIDDICTTKSTEDGYQWFYEGRNGGWWAYDKRTSKEIEEAYQVFYGQSIIDLEIEYKFDTLVCGKVYTIDFEEMVQYPKDMTTRRRKIRRAKNIKFKGIAGLTKNSLLNIN